MLLAVNQALALAYAQIRSAARLVRTWVFGILATATTLCVVVFYAYAHGIGAGGVAGGFAPRLLIGEFGVYLLWVLLIGVVFLAFDLRDTDVRDHIAEALDAKPATNVVMIVGRLAGTIAVVSVPVVFTIGVLQLAGWSARRTDYWMGDMIEPFSLIGFVFVDVIPALVVWSALIMLLAVLLRNRIAVVITAVALLVMQFWLVHKVPAHVLPAISVVSYVGRSASDLVPWIADSGTILHRGWLFLLAVGFCLIAAAGHPRRESGSSATRLTLGLSLTTLAVAGSVTAAVWGDSSVRQRDAWLTAHQAAREDLVECPDVEEIRGSVRIDPGRTLEIDVEVSFLARGDPGSLVFSLNPGLRIESLRLNGRHADFSHEAGLLTVHPAQLLTAGTRGRLALAAAGVPDPEFGYLDGAVDWRKRTATNSIRYLGTEASLFHRDYVALTPAVHWLPTAGVNLDSHREPDLFRIDLLVEAPRGWLIAGPGRQPQQRADPAHFKPTREVREVGLYASLFERRVVTLQGIDLELLASPKHMSNLAYFAPARDAIVRHLGELLANLQRLGLQYEDRVLSLVEVPSVLRTYRGGWRLQPVRTPGVLLLREERLPLARFGFMMSNDANSEQDAELKFQNLIIYLSDGFGVVDIFRSFASNLVAGTAMVGKGSEAFDYVLDELAFRSLFPFASNSYGFSAHSFDTEAALGTSIRQLITAITSGHLGHMVRATHRDSLRPHLWPDAARFSLAELAGLEPQRGTSALMLMGASLAQAIVDTLGVEGTGEFLGRLRQLESPFRSDALIALAKETDAVVGTAFDQAWREPGLPGFLVSPVDVVRLGNVGSGQQPELYQITVHVRNEEAAWGAVRLGYNEYDAATDPVWVPGGSTVEIGMIASQQPNQLWLLPYLSLNRNDLRLNLPREIEVVVDASSHFVGARPSIWRPPPSDDIVVDDLDAGFSISSDGRGTGWRFPAAFRRRPAGSDGGLPDIEHEAGEWIRRSVPGSWGTYRHTVAQANSGNGEHRAVFETDLAGGRWRLDYHLPPRHIPPLLGGGYDRTTFPALGSIDVDIIPVYHMTTGVSEHVASYVGERHVNFDAAGGHSGWNTLGTFDLPSGGVRVEISNSTDGDAVIADAIRWRRLE